MLVYALPPRILVDISDLSEQHVTDPPDSQKNYLVVDHKTETSAIEEAFDSFTQERKDIAILLINQHVRRYSTWNCCQNLVLTPDIDRRQDPQPRRRIHPSIPFPPRDPLKGPPLRPGEGQRHEARQEVVWRVIQLFHPVHDTPNSKKSFKPEFKKSP